MSAYTEQVLIDKLRLLNDSQQSIQTLSHWIMYHRKRHRTSVEIWKRELFKAPKDRRLLFLWLANDIVQTSRKKGNEFVKEFGNLLESSIAFVYSDSSDSVKKQIRRMLDIWVERNVYSKEFVAGLKAHLMDKSKNGSSAAPHSLEGESLHIAFKESPIANAMRELEEAAIAQDLNAEKVSGLRPGLLDGLLLNQASNPRDAAALAAEMNEATQVLDQYRRSLEDDLERRGNFITMLTECILQQENTINQTTNHLQTCLQQLARAEELKNQIKTTYPSLSIGGSNTAIYPNTGGSAATAKNYDHQDTSQLHTGESAALPYGMSHLQQPHRPLKGGPSTPPGTPPAVDDDDDVILDASATNPFKKQKLSSSTSASSSSVLSATTDSFMESLAALVGSPPHPVSQYVPPQPSYGVPSTTSIALDGTTPNNPVQQPLPYGAPHPGFHQWASHPLQHHQQHNRTDPQPHTLSKPFG